MTKINILLLCCLSVASSTSWATNLTTPANISHVTVFSDRAQITRQLSQTLPAGDSTLVINELPANLIKESIRVKGQGEHPITLLGLENQRVFNENLSNDRERKLATTLQRLNDELRGINDQIKSLNQQLVFINTLSQANPGRQNGKEHNSLPIEQWQQGWETIGQGAQTTYTAIHEQEILARSLDRKISKTQRQLNQVRSGRKAFQQVKIRLHSEQATTANFELSYQIYGPSWQPTYDLYLDTQTQKITLRQQATVQQNTGEDWQDINLTLSTTSARSNTRPPELSPWFIDFELAREVSRMAVSRKANRLDQAKFNSTAIFEASDMVAASPQIAKVHDTGFSAEYQLAGKISLASNNQAHSFTITEHLLDAALEIRAVPKYQATAYLFATTEYSGKAPLPAGPLNIFRDNAYVGSSHLNATQSGDEIQLGLGEDPRVKISYEVLGNMRANKGLFNDKRRIEKHVAMTIENLHKRAMPILVEDQLPVAQDERINVEVLEQSTPTNHHKEDAQPGSMAWQYTYQSNEKRTLNFSYSVTYPADMTLPGFR